MDGLIYDFGGSYGDAELTREGIDPNTVLTSRLQSPYIELLQTTPTVLAVSKTGVVLGMWRGEMSAGRVTEIERVLSGL